MDIYQKIDEFLGEEIFKEDMKEDVLKEILFELREIKALFAKKTKRLPRSYYDFVNEFRAKFKEEPINGKYPEFRFNGKLLAINEKGLLYNKETKRILSTNEAFSIFEALYNHKNKIIQMEK